MKPLPDEFEQKGHQIKVIRRTNGRTPDVALCSRINLRAYQPSKHWEVVLIQRQEAGVSIIGGDEVVREAKELYPGDNTWGTHGWTFQTYQRAVDKFESLDGGKKRKVKKVGISK